MANSNNITLRQEKDSALSIDEMDQNFSELRNVITEFNLYTAADFFDTFVDRGNWAGATDYSVKDLVRYNGSVYLCIEAHQSDTTVIDPQFEPQYWKLWQGKFNRQASTLSELTTFGGFYDNDVISMLNQSESKVGQWVWNSVSTLTENGADVIKVISMETGRWIHKDLLDPEFFLVNSILGYSYVSESELFNKYNYIDMLLGKVYSGTASVEETELVDRLNKQLGYIVSN